MLPDWPKTKAALHEVLQTAAERQRQKEHPLMQQVGRQIYHEGRGGLLVREGGEEDSTELQEMSATTLFEGKELGALPLKDVYERLYEAVSDLGGQQEKAVIKGVQQAVAKIGNTVSGDGRKLSPELLIEAYEKIQMSGVNPLGWTV